MQGHSQDYRWCTAAADTCVAFYFLKRFLMAETQTHTHNHTHTQARTQTDSGLLSVFMTGSVKRPSDKAINKAV